MFNESQIRTLKIVLGCLVIFSIFFIHGLRQQPLQITFQNTHVPFAKFIPNQADSTEGELEDFQPVVLDPSELDLLHEEEGASTLSDSINTANDSSKVGQKADLAEVPTINLHRFTAEDQLLHGSDSVIRERILLIGDSQVECIRNAIYNYSLHNQHKLVGAVTWYGSVTLDWGYSDTLSYYIQKVKPTVIIFAIGLNEIFVKPGEDRKREFKNVLDRIQAHGLKYCVLGPAAWTKDYGIVEAMAEIAGKHFFDASKMTLPRASDGRHPSLAGGYTWFEAAAEYMTANLDIDFAKKITGKKYFEKNSPLYVIANKRYKKGGNNNATASAVAKKTEKTELPSPNNSTPTTTETAAISTTTPSATTSNVIDSTPMQVQTAKEEKPETVTPNK